MTPALANTTGNEQWSGEAFRVVDGWLDSVQAYQKIPAMSAGIVIADKLVWAKGYGTIDARQTIRASPDTIYSVCSISKVFTSIALMQQVEAGKVNLDAPVAKYLPWARLQPDKDATDVTIRRVLSHSAGLPRDLYLPYWSAPDFKFPSRDDIRQMLARETLLPDPGRYYHYSNVGMVLVGELTEQVSGKPYAEYCKTHLLTPLGLADTRTVYPVELAGRQLAVGYGALSRDGTRSRLQPFDTKGLTAAAGFSSTVADLAKFISWQFRILRTDKANLLTPSTLREMQRVQFLSPDWERARGLGYAIERKDGKIYAGHDGKCPGYSTEFLMRNQDETGVIVLMNAMEDPNPVVHGIYAILDKRKDFQFSNPQPDEKVNPETYAGHYSSQPWSSEELIVPWAKGLVLLTLPSKNPVESMVFLKPKGKDLFLRVRNDGSEAESFRFSRDKSGKVMGYFHSGNWSKRLKAGG